MKELTPMNNRIVLLVADAMPLGLTPSQIRQKIPEMTPQALHIHLITLLKKRILIKHKEGILTYYQIAPEGINTISRLVVHQPENVNFKVKQASLGRLRRFTQRSDRTMYHDGNGNVTIAHECLLPSSQMSLIRSIEAEESRWAWYGKNG